MQLFNKMSTEDGKLAEMYQQMTPIQHVLNKSAMYVGSTELIDSNQYICADDGQIINKNIQYNPGFNKICDELFVNATDHATRTNGISAATTSVATGNKVTKIEVTINKATGRIEVTNDGPGIDVAQHPEYKTWIPELIFAHLRTSTNYDKEEQKIVGGMNGLGAKLAIILSEYASIRTIDSVRGLEYFQEFRDNLSVINNPVVKKTKAKSFTTIVIQPDYKRFGLVNGLTDDIIALLKRRVYDMAAIVGKGVKVRYSQVCSDGQSINDLVPIKTFKQYIDLFIGAETPRVYEDAGERWEFAVALSKDIPNLTKEFHQISWVNGIYTSDGGKHVEYILNQITRKLADYIETKKKVKVNPSYIKEQLVMFVRCDIVNPVFNSQTKEYMNSPVAKFGSKCDVSDKLVEKLAKMGVMDAACALTDLKDNKAAKKTDGAKTNNVRGIPKYTGANWAGTAKSEKCTLILCEGDSAKAGIISGLSSDDRNTTGVYPLKGKPMNVKGELLKRVSENKEICELKKILGLETAKVYKSTESLRYGKVMFMTDQDLDGSHIKGLCINLFQTLWPSLLEIPGFIGFMNTPILKARKGQQELQFYNDGEYEEWKKTNDSSAWTIKYYKGLGTSTGKEFREYFANKKIVGFEFKDKPCNDAIELVFDKKRSDDRKKWLDTYDRESYLDTSQPLVTYQSFINKEFIHFSKYDCDRSIPNLMDGLKTSQRKILFAAFKKNLTTEIKVAQFSGYVSEHSCYHHGEASLNGAIVGMAQNFVGSNNINLLVPSGQFGTRLQGGSDSASERYIFTYLNRATRLIYPQADDAILTYLDDDGTLVEPQFYAPIIPMVLVNGANGIGTGFSTNIPCYNPMDVIDYLKAKLNAGDYDKEFVPYYQGFTGTIESKDLSSNDRKFIVKGTYKTDDKTGKIHVTELPVGYWTDDFKAHLESLIEQGKIKDYTDMSKDTTVDFTIKILTSEKEKEKDADIEKLLKLSTSLSTSNMHLFDANDKLKKYANVEDIIDDYYVTRLELYKKRKAYLQQQLEQELLVLTNKAQYIRDTLDNKIDLRNKTKDQVQQIMSKFVKVDNSHNYLTKMPMDSVTEENVAKIFKDKATKEEELIILTKTTENQMWNRELDVLRTELNSKTDELKAIDKKKIKR